MLCLLVPPDDAEAIDAALHRSAHALVFDLGEEAVPGERSARRRATLEILESLQNPLPSSLAGEGVVAKPQWMGDQPRRVGVASPSTPATRRHFLARGEKGNRPESVRPVRVVRLAPLSSGLVDADLDAVLSGAPDAVMLPGAVGGADLQHLAAKLAVSEAEHGLAAGRTGIVAAPADTAAGVLALGTLPGANPRLRALLWDPATLALALDTGLDAAPVRTARDLLVLAASACGVPAIDGSPAVEDGACRDGFAGRLMRVP